LLLGSREASIVETCSGPWFLVGADERIRAGEVFRPDNEEPKPETDDSLVTAPK
jgi:hypothetical protein